MEEVCNKMKINLYEIPQAEIKPKIRRQSANVQIYDPLEKAKEQTRFEISRYMMMQTGDKKMDEEARYLRYKDFYHVAFTFVFPIHKSDRKTLKKAKLAGLKSHEIFKDLDDLEKYYLDCLAGTVFSDDKKVVKLQSEKRWSENGHTEITIEGFDYVQQL